MSYTFGPRPDRGSPPHERAAMLIAERIDTRLEPEEAAWLDAHLANCRSCRALADAYASDRNELRKLRNQPVEPPRDLWARTSAALEREAGRLGRMPRRARRRPPPAPLSAAAGLLVVAVVIGASILSGQPVATRTPPSQPTVAPTLVAVSLRPTATVVPTPEPTRLAIPNGEVPFLAEDDAGNQALYTVDVSEVCPNEDAACAPIPASSPRVIDLPDTPHAVILSPDDEQLVVVNAGATGAGGAVLVMPVPTEGGQPSAEPSPPPTSTPPSPTATATHPPATSAPPSEPGSAPPPATAPPTTAPPAASPTPTVTVSPAVSGTASTQASGSSAPGESVDVTASADVPSPTPSAAATAAAAPTAIAEDVVVDSETAAFSADGRHLAFSARPADGSHGPDIYLWETDGTDPAVPLTTDHRSVFAGWVDGLILGSRVVEEAPSGAASSEAPPASVEPAASSESALPSGSEPSAAMSASAGVSASAGESATAEASASVESSVPPASEASAPSAPAKLVGHGEAFLIDPATGEVTVLPGRSLWRPSVDPSGSRAVWWDGGVERDEAGDWRATNGRLVLGPWTPEGGAAPAATPPVPSVEGHTESVDVLAEGPIVDWDAQWDITGTRLAVWIADPDDPSIGKLSLYIVDPETGRLAPGLAPLRDERALPGFAIDDNRLVWATPPGQDAEGSHVSVLAWTATGVGTVEIQPATEIVVIR